MTTPEKELYTTREVADMFNVRIETVRAWIREGKIKAIATPGGQHRITAKAVRDAANRKYGAYDASQES